MLGPSVSADGVREGLHIISATKSRRILWASKKKQHSNSLLNTIYFYNGKVFGLRGGDHRNIVVNNLKLVEENAPSVISASKQRRNRTNPVWKTTQQIQFPKQCILKFWTVMRSKSGQLPFVTSFQRIQSFGSIFHLQITLERTKDTINSLRRVSSLDYLATSIMNFDNQ